jgi:TP901-1 family phage major tail protein
MAAQKGRLHLLKIGASGAGGTVAGLRNLRRAHTNEPVDITNKDSGGFRELLEGAGTQSLDITADGVATDGATYETLKGYANAGSINAFQIIGPDNDAYSASFLITAFEEASSYHDELKFTLTMQSSGTITPTEV